MNKTVYPCPLPDCQGTLFIDHDETQAFPQVWCVKCTGCHMQGPSGDCNEAAIILWNSLPRENDPPRHVLPDVKELAAENARLYRHVEELKSHLKVSDHYFNNGVRFLTKTHKRLGRMLDYYAEAKADL